MISQESYTEAARAADFNRMANSILSDILAANPWIQRFCAGALQVLARNPNNAKNLTKKYSFFFGGGADLMSLDPHVKLCSHIKVTGVRCGSPALRDENFCYFHLRMFRGVPTPKKSRIHPIALIENEESIQAALMETINAIVRNQIDLPRAKLILKALSIAARNSSNVSFDTQKSEMVRELPQPEPEFKPENKDEETMATTSLTQVLTASATVSQLPEQEQSHSDLVPLPRKPMARTTASLGRRRKPEEKRTPAKYTDPSSGVAGFVCDSVSSE